jgi:hypothetical protein
MVILELEASSPGNERNILKWAAPVIQGSSLGIRQGSKGDPVEFDSIEVVLCFGREPRGQKKSDWSDSDFERTVAHCQILAEILNEKLHTSLLRFSVLKTSDRVTNWKEFGQSAAMEYAVKRG